MKGSMFTISMIELMHYDAQDFSDQLADTVNQAPRFFHQMPVVISLEQLPDDLEINFVQLVDICREQSVNPVGIRGGSEQQIELARHAGLPVMGAATTRRSSEKKAVAAEETASSSKASEPAESEVIITQQTRIIDRPVRSGQQIYAQNGSLVVLAPVSAGAELLADGDIHVYGPLRGRVLAGINGNTKARIFCHSLEAELLSIAGNYKLSEHLQHLDLWKKSIQARLEDENRLQITALYTA
ncbi:septum site-determining protein MinC [Pokkaliibacter sp. CJK22405]|uniref:septum site-determining protein MinC n=1 Tax=Pokkaliibacter sp. CJK22405 TaxID=3384615 RepID=UPI003984881D